MSFAGRYAGGMESVRARISAEAASQAPQEPGMGQVLKLPGIPIPPDGVDATPKPDRLPEQTPAQAATSEEPSTRTPAPWTTVAPGLAALRAWMAQRAEMLEVARTRLAELNVEKAELEQLVAELEVLNA